MTSLKDAEQAHKKGLEELKTSIFNLKFSPDYVNAVCYFEKAGKLFEINKKYNESINSYLKAIECNKKLLESYAEAQNHLKISEIYIFYMKNEKKAMEFLKESQICFKLAGKYNNSLRIMLDFTNQLEEKSRNSNETDTNQSNNLLISFSIHVLEEAWTDACQFAFEKMVRIEIDNIYSKLINVYMKNTEIYLKKGIDLTFSFLKVLQNDKTGITKPYHIVNVLSRLVMLRFIDNSLDFTDIIVESERLYDSSVSDDISDMKRLCLSLKNRDEKEFNYCLSHVFHLFEMEILKEVKRKFTLHLKENTIEVNEYLGNAAESKRIVYDMNDDEISCKKDGDVIYLNEADLMKDYEKEAKKEEDFY